MQKNCVCCCASGGKVSSWTIKQTEFAAETLMKKKNLSIINSSRLFFCWSKTETMQCSVEKYLPHADKWINYEKPLSILLNNTKECSSSIIPRQKYYELFFKRTISMHKNAKLLLPENFREKLELLFVLLRNKWFSYRFFCAKSFQESWH